MMSLGRRCAGWMSAMSLDLFESLVALTDQLQDESIETARDLEYMEN